MSVSKFIYVFNENDKENLLNMGFKLLNNSCPFIFDNSKDVDNVVFDKLSVVFSNTMQF